MSELEWKHIRSDGRIFWLKGDCVWLRDQMRTVWDYLNASIEIDEEWAKKEAEKKQEERQP